MVRAVAPACWLKTLIARFPISQAAVGPCRTDEAPDAKKKQSTEGVPRQGDNQADHADYGCDPGQGVDRWISLAAAIWAQRREFHEPASTPIRGDTHATAVSTAIVRCDASQMDRFIIVFSVTAAMA